MAKCIIAVVLWVVRLSACVENVTPEGSVSDGQEYIEADDELPHDYEYEEPEEINYDIMLQYIDWYERNNDMVGWINIPGTKLDYPVVQYRRYDDEGLVTGDNQYYLYRDFDENNNTTGTIYAEWRFPFTPEFRPDNSVLYGHNTGDGTMFNAAADYYAYHRSNNGSIQFYLDNPLIYFDTLYTPGVYKVFAAIYVHTEENRYDDVFDYFRWRIFPDEDTFFAFVTNVMDRSSFHTDVDLKYGDEILTLSTSYFKLGHNVDSRIAVFARRVRPGESTDVNLSAAELNPGPLYFAEYYKQMGGSWAGRNWNTNLVHGLDTWLAERGDSDIPLLYSDMRAEMERNILPADTTTMPDLIGMDYDEARMQFPYLNLNPLQDFSSEFLRGQIMHQSVQVNREIYTSQQIDVIVSMGPQLVELRNYEGGMFTADDVVTMIIRQGFNSPRIIHEENPDIPAGFVIRTDPPALSMIELTENITIWVSMGYIE